MTIFHLVFQKGLDSIKKDLKHSPQKQIAINKKGHKIKVNSKDKEKEKIID